MKLKSLNRLCFSLCLLCALVLADVFTFAQTVTGSLVGNVTDAGGNVIPGAQVVATDIERGTKREAVTNEEGNYTISSMEPGTYRVEVQQQGFKRSVNEGAEVRINTTVRVDAALEAGGVTETVDVSGEQALLKTDRSDLSQQITATQVQELPLSPDRNYQSVLEITPGVSEASEVGSAFGNPNGSLVNRVNGQNERNNSFQLDGTINNQTNVISQTAIVPPPEAIQVVDLATNAYDAESGRSTGGIVNVQIKSGTNAYHGDVFIYNTNSAFRAREYFSTLEQPNTNLTQFGFTFGGPIKRNKTFFFGDYQGGRDRQGQSVLLSVPTEAFRNGDFSGASTIHDPQTGTASGANRTAFAGNIIPQSRISPVARAILSRLPLPTRAGLTSNYEASGTFVQDRDAFDIKINHVFNESTNAFVRYSYFQAQTADPPVFGTLGGPATDNGLTAAIGPSRNQSASLNLTHAFSSTLVTEFRAGLVRVLIQGAPPSEDDLATQVGIPGINDGSFFTGGLPRITISGYTFLGSATTLPFKIAETSYNFVNNWTKTTGNHTIRFGADIRNLILNKAQATGSNPRGEFTFTTGPTARSGGPAATSANAFAAFLLGLPQSEARTTVNQLGGFRQRQYFFFVQDRWQTTPNLTLNYGLRYEIYPYAVPANPGDLARYVPETNQNLIAGYGSVDERLGVKTDYTNFAPRFGIAYRLTDKTVLRGGYGIGYHPLGINALAGRNFPGQVDLRVAGANSFQAAGNIANGIPRAAAVDPTSGIVVPPGNVALDVINPNMKRGYVQSFNATVQQDIFDFVTEVSYVGSLSTRLPGTININAAGPGSATADRPLNRLYGRTADIFYTDFFLSANYHALQSKVERRFRGGDQITVAYTWSKAIDYTDAFALQDDFNIDNNRGLCDCDRTHAFVVSHVLRSPFGRGRRFLADNRVLGGILGGWSLSGVFTARSGSPIDITGVSLVAARVQGSTARPNLIGDPRILGGIGPGQLYFDTSAFGNPAAGQFGNVGRNTVRGPGYASYNLTLARTFSLSERLRLRLTGSGFNITNTPRFENPSSTFTAGDFGEINDTVNGSERRFRFGAKLSF
ncbi:MAG: TonB-dependent receptor [Acidobacteriota bacterium]|nr:TonB-dependent receptor [Acidobacteriota bacterium]